MRLGNNFIQNRPVFTATIQGDNFDGKDVIEREMDHGVLKDFKEDLRVVVNEQGVRCDLGKIFDKSYSIFQTNPNTERGLTGCIASGFADKFNKDVCPQNAILRYFETRYNAGKPYIELRNELNLNIPKRV